MCTVPGLSRVCRESYNDPYAAYETLKRRGMDLVTVTDHDSIDAVEELQGYPDFFLSEEVSCTMPSGTQVHAGVYGITERDHIELQRRRTDVHSLLAYAAERRLFVTVNHAYSSLTGSRAAEDFEVFSRDFHGIETVNGQMLACANNLASVLAAQSKKPATGGSDAHTLLYAGKTWTEVPGASNVDEYLLGLRCGAGAPAGESGKYWKLTLAVLSIGVSMVRSSPWTLLLSPLFAAAPLITAGNHFREVWFAWYWRNRTTVNSPAAALPEIAQ